MKFNANTKIIIMITTLLLVLSVSISLLNFIVSLNAKQQELKHRSLPLSIENIYTEIQRNIIEPNLISSMMAHDTFVKEWLHHQETDRNKIQNYLASIQQKYGMFLTFLVSEKTLIIIHKKALSKNSTLKTRTTPGTSALKTNQKPMRSTWTTTTNFTTQ